MNKITEQLTAAQKYAMSIRPKVGGFPVLAEVLRQAGVQMNRWSDHPPFPKPINSSRTRAMFKLLNVQQMLLDLCLQVRCAV